MKKILRYFIYSCISLSAINAQTWTKFTTNEGLAGNTVYAIKIDKQGIKWLCTNSGLSKYDNVNWTTYTAPDNLGYNNYYAMIFDSEDNILIGTEGYLLKFDGTNWNNYKLKDVYSILSIALDSKDSIWVSTLGGGNVFKLIDTTWSEFSISANFGYSLAIDSIDNKWIGTNKGLSVLDSLNILTNYDTANGIADNEVLSVAINKKGNKWFGTYSKGVTCFDGTNWTTYSNTDGLGGNKIQSIYIDDNDDVWFGHENGVSMYDGVKWSNYNTSGLVNVISIAIDSEGTKWFGTISNGLFRYIESLSGLSESADPEIIVYPNPVKNILSISNINDVSNISIFDLTGKEMISGSGESQIDFSRLPMGIYLLKIHTPGGTIAKRVVKITTD